MKHNRKVSKHAWWLVPFICLLASIGYVRATESAPSQQGLAGFEQALTPRISSMPKNQLVKWWRESELGYVKRITDIVHLATYQCDPTDFQLSLLDRIAIFVLNVDVKRTFLSEGLLDPDRFQCGLCSQRAFIAHRFLSDNGIKSEMFGLEGHVVLRVHLGGTIYYTDPDYGVGPFSLTPGGDIEQEITKVYSMSSVDRSSLISKIYATLHDNRPYANYLNEIYKDQVQVFRLAEVFYRVCLVAVIAGLLTAAYQLVTYRRKTVQFS